MSKIDEEVQQQVNDITGEINEDEIIKKVMIEYPDIYNQLEYNEYTVKDKLEKNPYLYQQYRLLWLKEKHKLHRIELLMEEYVGNLYHDLRFENTIKLGKVEVEKYYLPKDERVIKFKKLFLIQTIRVETFDTIVKSFDKQGFTMNTFVKVIQE